MNRCRLRLVLLVDPFESVCNYTVCETYMTLRSWGIYLCVVFIVFCSIVCAESGKCQSSCCPVKLIACYLVFAVAW